MSKYLTGEFVSTVVGIALLSIATSLVATAVTLDDKSPAHRPIGDGFTNEDARAFLTNYCIDCHVGDSDATAYFEL